MSEQKREIKLTRVDKKTIAKNRETLTDTISSQMVEENEKKKTTIEET